MGYADGRLRRDLQSSPNLRMGEERSGTKCLIHSLRSPSVVLSTLDSNSRSSFVGHEVSKRKKRPPKRMERQQTMAVLCAVVKMRATVGIFVSKLVSRYAGEYPRGSPT